GQVYGRVAFADFNMDCKPDLVAVSSYASADLVSVALGNGDGTFQTAKSFSSHIPVEVAASDFNGDGKVDLVIGNQDVGVSVLPGNGDGTFQVGQMFPLEGVWHGLVVGDFNGDGKRDIVRGDFTNNGYSGVTILIGNGDGTLQP